MNFGVSTSCLYPMQTELALKELGKAGVKSCEVFVNSLSETTTDFAKTLNEIKENYEMNIVSVHHITTYSYMYFDEYERRHYEGLEFHKRFFEFAGLAGAKYFVIHGLLNHGKISENEYFERFTKLSAEGKNFGITVAQENVHRHLSENPDFLERMKNAIGDDFKLIFDIKQAVRSGYSPFEFVDKFKNDIVHIHASDHNSQSDCIVPGKGFFDFKKLFNEMERAGFNGKYIVELYRSGFGNISELTDALDYMRNL